MVWDYCIQVIYNSRNYSILLNCACSVAAVHIYNSRNYSILLNSSSSGITIFIYNSRNYSILLNQDSITTGQRIYNSRNYSILLNHRMDGVTRTSTTVEIILYYLTVSCPSLYPQSTTVEIILYYLTKIRQWLSSTSTTVEIILYYLTSQCLIWTKLSTTVEIILYYLTPNLCIRTIFWSQATLFLLFYITFAQYMLSNIDYYKIKVQVCITLWWKNHFLHFWHNHILELHSLMTVWKYIHYLIVKIVFQMCSSNR